MFRLLTMSSLILIFSASAFAADVTVTWDANSESDLAGYKVYYGTESEDYSQSTDVGNVTQISVGNLQNNTTYYFAVTAYDASGNESGFSQEASITIPPAEDNDAPQPPRNVRVVIGSSAASE